MAGLYQFTVQLNDKVSGPAHEAEGGIKSFAETMGAVKNAVTQGVAGITTAFDALKKGDIGEAFQSIAESAAGMAKMLDLVVPGLGEAVSAVIEIGGLIGGIVLGLAEKGAEMALEASEAKEKMTALFDALGEGQVQGSAVIGMLDNLSSQVGLTRAQLAPLAQQFMAMGQRDLPTLQRSLTAAASAQALMGESGAQAYVNLSKKINEAVEAGGKLKLSSKALGQQLAGVGLDLDDVAKAMGTTGPKLAAALKAGTVDAKAFGDAMQKALIEKGAGPLEKMASSFEFLKASFKENISKLFEDVDVKPFTDALKDLGSIFSQNSASGRAMKAAITAVFNAIFSVAKVVFPYIKKAIELVIIAGLKIYIAFKPVIAQLKQLFGGVGANVDVLKFFKMELEGAADIAAKTAGFIMGLIKVGVFLYNTFEHAKDAAKALIDGLVNGIKNGTGMVVDAIKNLGKSAMGALKGLLGISSPSKVMMEFGVQTGAGFSAGIDAQGPVVQASAGGLATAAIEGLSKPPGGAPPAAPPSAPGGVPNDKAFDAGSYDKSGGGDKGKSKGDIKVEATFTFNGGVQGAEELTEQAVSVIFERIALEQGL
jgi:hypothetical protein